MKLSLRSLALLCAIVSPLVPATPYNLQSLVVHAPENWRMNQDALSKGTRLLGFSKGAEYLRLYAREGASSGLKYSDGVSVNEESHELHGPLYWDTKHLSSVVGLKNRNLFVFSSQFNGYSYYGYSVGESAKENAVEFLDGLMVHPQGRSLTGDGYFGKKYYLGWGAAGMFDPDLMQNEVKYDVMHTHDIFTANIGGNYLGKTLIGPSVKAPQIRAAWKEIKDVMTAEDMYVQYSSGHGSPTGLSVGVNYSEIRDNALAYPAREIIIFTMACNSGGLVNSFDAKKSVWKDWEEQGRTLMVMASSKVSENSSTGPGTDPDEAQGPDGSAGSAFGHALWKALIGYADGALDGVQDGFLALGEIRDFTIEKTQAIGDHTPVSTGAYNPNLVMNQVPPAEWVQTLENSTEGLSDAQIAARIEELDRHLRLR